MAIASSTALNCLRSSSRLFGLLSDESLWEESLEFVGEGGRADDFATVGCFFNSMVIGERFLGGTGSTVISKIFLKTISRNQLHKMQTFFRRFSFYGFFNTSLSW